eukprot:COSAG01_NODE_1135_length_11553_cov_40.402305_2_plen_277_part_00
MVPSDIKDLAVVSLTFDKRFSWSNSNYKLKVVNEHVNAGHLVIDDRDFKHLQDSAIKIMDTFKKGNRFSVRYGKEVIDVSEYQNLLKSFQDKQNKKKNKKNKANKDVKAGEGAEDLSHLKNNTFYVAPYQEIKLKKKQRRALCEALKVDAIATVNFSYFYIERYSFNQSVLRNINPMTWVRQVGILFKARERNPNSMGLSMQIEIFNTKGNRIVKTQYFSLLEQGPVYRLPGYTFHLYPSLRSKIFRSTAILINNADDFQTLSKHVLSPAYRVAKH